MGRLLPYLTGGEGRGAATWRLCCRAVAVAAVIGSLFPSIMTQPARAQNGGGTLASYSAAVQANSPLAYYHLDEEGVTLANDASGNHNYANYIGPVSQNHEGMLTDDGAVGLSGNSTYVGGPETLSALSGSHDRTVEMWFRTYQGGNIFHAGAFSHTQAFDLATTSSAGPGGCGNPGGVGFYLRTWDNDVFIPYPVNDGNWHYVAVTVSNSGQTVSIDIDGFNPDGYIWNGVCYQADSQPQPFNMPYVINTAPGGFTLGGPGWTGGINGGLDETAIYNHALPSVSMTYHFNVGNGTANANGAPGVPLDVNVSPFNGGVTVTWQAPDYSGAGPLTGYQIYVTPVYNDRLPAPPAAVAWTTVGASVTSKTFTGLVEDCHERYQVSVQAENASATGPAALSDTFRPSGIVAQHQAPPYVVILIDGIGENQPGFTEDAYTPTTDSMPSYCPESWYQSTGQEDEAAFASAPNGPWSFFHKWNVGEVDMNGNATGTNPDGSSPNTESSPRALPGNPNNLASGTSTHSYMLDALAAQGAVILPFSYKGYGFGMAPDGDPLFTFYGYSICQSVPGCGPSIESDASLLGGEINDAAATWPNAKIIVMGHSQGGLIAYTWWLKHSHPSHFVDAVSLDSPINGACPDGPPVCVGPPSYPQYGARRGLDPFYLGIDAAQGDSFRFVGTYGDSPAGGYGSGAETLEHQLLFDYRSYTINQVESDCSNPGNESSCPAPAPPDHISECPVNVTAPWETAHYTEKYCPGDVNYFNNLFGFNY